MIQITRNRNTLIHWGRVTHICVSKLTIIGSDNGLSPGRRQAIIWTNAGILLIGPIGTNFSEILIIQENAFESVVCETAAILSRPQCVKMHRSIMVGNEEGSYVHPTQDSPIPTFSSDFFHAFSDKLCCQKQILGEHGQNARFQGNYH